jgi:hypothetical protein
MAGIFYREFHFGTSEVSLSPFHRERERIAHPLSWCRKVRQVDCLLIASSGKNAILKFVSAVLKKSLVQLCFLLRFKSLAEHLIEGHAIDR